MHRTGQDQNRERSHSVAVQSGSEAVVATTRAAVVLAGGTGRRVGGPAPKQLIEVAGRPLLSYAIEAFETSPGIDEIVVVMAAGHEPAATEIAKSFHKVKAVIPGGDTRTESTLRAMETLRSAPDDSHVLFHDAARPFVDQAVIDRCLSALTSYEAVAVGVQTSDTIVEIADDRVISMPPRAALRRFQTPQGFHLGTLRRAYDLALADKSFTATDDCGVVHRYLPDIPIKVVEGNERNIKITHLLDLVIAEHLAGRR